LNGLTPDQAVSGHQDVVAALDRLDAALARIARVQRELAQREPEPAARVDAVNGEQPEWAKDVAGRLDGLIGELRRALSGEQV